jgi:diguanylate cyclase (GGDEF)-like protein
MLTTHFDNRRCKLATYFKTSSLKARIMLSMVLLTVAGMSVFVTHVTSVLQDDVKRLLEGQLKTTANYVAADIDSKIKLRLDILNKLALSFPSEALSSQALTQQFIQQQQFATTLFPAGVGAVTSSGKIIAEAGLVIPGRRGGTVPNIDIYLKAMAGCKTLVSPPMIGPYSRRAIFALAAPVCNQRGEILGLIMGVIPLSDADVFGQLEKASAVPGSYLLVVSRHERRIVAADDKKRILEMVNDKTPLTNRRLNEKFEGSGIGVNPHGIEVLTVSRNLQRADWYVVAAVPTKVAFAPIANLKLQIIVSAALLTFFASVILLLLLKKLLAPLDTAGLAMRRMTDGSEPLTTLPIQRRDEIGQLIQNFNKLVVERKVVEEKIEFIAHHDALTGLPNRLMIQKRFDEAVEYAQQHELRVGLLFLDLDNFKTINDSLGHVVGDELLKVIGDILQDCVRETDTVGRLSGDEYLIVLRDIPDAAAINMVLNKIQKQFSSPIIIEGRELLTSASVGVAVYPEDGLDFASLYKKTDTAMYQAKDTGKNTHCFFDLHMNVDSVESVIMRSDLKHALNRHEFILHYQPQIDIETGNVTGVEALIRWNHPKLGLVMPGSFISIAEDSGLIVPLGEWVIREACQQAVAWQKAGLPDMVMAVNLSALQFKRGNLEDTLVSALLESGLDPSLLELELTESILIKNTDHVLQMVRRLKNLGLKFSIDDFGTGYSSLAYLKKFAVDKIKIDQSFVRGLANDTENTAIVKAIIQMARSLNLKTIAEGVEDEITLQHLRIHHCDEAQGYFFAKPMPAENLMQYVADGLKERGRLTMIA